MNSHSSALYAYIEVFKAPGNRNCRVRRQTRVHSILKSTNLALKAKGKFFYAVSLSLLCWLQVISSKVPMAGTLTIGSLSDELLANIFRQEALSEQPYYLPLVCKRWSQVYATESTLWDNVELSLSNPARKRQDLHSFLLWARTKRDKIWGFTGNTRDMASLAVVAQLTALQSLNLIVVEPTSLVQPFLDILISMPKLEELDLRQEVGVQILTQMVDISPCRHLTGLTMLQLGRSIVVDGGAQAVAASASALAVLSVSVHGWQALLPLSHLKALRFLELDAEGIPSVGGDLSSLLPVLGHLTGLVIEHMESATDLGISANTHTDLRALTLRGMHGLEDLPPSLLGLATLESLFIQHMPSVDMSNFLAQVSSSVLPGFNSLSLELVLMSSFPSVLTSLQGLTYLSCQPLTLSQFTSLHEGMTAVRQLKQLHLYNMDHLVLDVGILLALPHLRELHIPDCKHLKLKVAEDYGVFRGMRALEGHSSLVKINLSGTALMC